MDVLRDVLVVLHFIGLASLLGGFLVQIKPRVKVINAAMVHGVLTQLITGVALVGLAEMTDAELDHSKVAIKLGVAVVIATLVFMRRRSESVGVPIWASIGGLTVVNLVVAVIW